MIRCAGHSLKIFTTTIKQAGEKQAVGECKCGWRGEDVYAVVVRAQYRKHVKDAIKALQEKKAGV